MSVPTQTDRHQYSRRTVQISLPSFLLTSSHWIKSWQRPSWLPLTVKWCNVILHYIPGHLPEFLDLPQKPGPIVSRQEATLQPPPKDCPVQVCHSNTIHGFHESPFIRAGTGKNLDCLIWEKTKKRFLVWPPNRPTTSVWTQPTQPALSYITYFQDPRQDSYTPENILYSNSTPNHSKGDPGLLISTTISKHINPTEVLTLPHSKTKKNKNRIGFSYSLINGAISRGCWRPFPYIPYIQDPYVCSFIVIHPREDPKRCQHPKFQQYYKKISPRRVLGDFLGNWSTTDEKISNVSL